MVPLERIDMPTGFGVCWAGPNPLEDGLCFGSLDGRIFFADEEGRPRQPPDKRSASGEAVNGLARVGTWVAVTTRQEVNFFSLPGTEGGSQQAVAFLHGAHGITTTPSGYFIAPLGRTGIMAVRPPLSEETLVTVHGDEEGSFYAYGVISLRSEDGKEVLACAARSGGIGAVEFSGDRETHVMRRATFKGFDVVDLCPLRPEEDSLAVAVLGRDGSLVLSRDALRDTNPITMKFGRVGGTAYRILSSRGDVYVSTSRGMYVLGSLASRFLGGGLGDGTITPVLTIPMETVDAYLIGDRSLVVITAEEVRKYDVHLINERVPEELALGETQEFQQAVRSPTWEWEESMQTRKEWSAAA